MYLFGHENPGPNLDVSFAAMLVQEIAVERVDFAAKGHLGAALAALGDGVRQSGYEDARAASDAPRVVAARGDRQRVHCHRYRKSEIRKNLQRQVGGSLTFHAQETKFRTLSGLQGPAFGGRRCPTRCNGNRFLEWDRKRPTMPTTGAPQPEPRSHQSHFLAGELELLVLPPISTILLQQTIPEAGLFFWMTVKINC